MMWLSEIYLKKISHFQENSKNCGEMCKTGASFADAPEMFRN
jgi:hypothetical protein